MPMERPGDYLTFRMGQVDEDVEKMYSDKKAEYGSDAGYGQLPEGLPTDMNTFLIEHGITGDKLHDITVEINGDYEGFLKRAQSSDETWGIPQSEWNKLSTNSKIDFMSQDAKRISSEIGRLFGRKIGEDSVQAALMKLSEIALMKSTDFESESEEEETWKDISEGLSDMADRIGGLTGYSK